jgi:hypothetical protein
LSELAAGCSGGKRSVLLELAEGCSGGKRSLLSEHAADSWRRLDSVLSGAKPGGVHVAPRPAKDPHPLDEKTSREILRQRPDAKSTRWKIEIPLKELEDH